MTEAAEKNEQETLESLSTEEGLANYLTAINVETDQTEGATGEDKKSDEAESTEVDEPAEVDAGDIEEEEKPEDGGDDEQDPPQESEKNDASNISELQKKLKEFEKTTKQLELKLAESQIPAPAPTVDNPLSDVFTREELDDRVAKAEAWSRWAVENWDGGEYEFADGTKQELSDKYIRQSYHTAQNLIQKEAPRRAQYLRDHELANEHVKKIYPALSDKSSEDHQRMTKILRALPEIQRVSDYKLWIGRMLAGMKTEAETQEAQTKQKKSEPVALAPKAPKPSSAPKANGKNKKRELAEQRFLETGDEAALAELLAHT